MSPVDHAWYRMDSPENLMMVNAIMWTDDPIDPGAVRAKVETMVERFPKFTRHPVPAEIPFGRANWADDEDFDLDRHLLRHELDGSLEDYISAQIPVALDPSHPMWQIHFIDGHGDGSVLLFRMHHSIADGITITRVLLSLTDADETPGFTPTRDSGLIGLAERAVRLLATPDGVASAIRGAARLVHLAAIPPKPSSALTGTVGSCKRVGWREDWALADIKSISHAHCVTVNDVLLSVLADALGRYLRENDTPLDQVRVMVPVNLRPLDEPLSSDLGNVFGQYVVTLPTAACGPLERLGQMHANIEEIKRSPEAVVAYLTLVALGVLPSQVEDLSTRFFSGKVAATVSNVPGPQTPITIAGTEVSGVIGWVPGAGAVALGVSMFSYNGRVLIGLIADEAVIPDLGRLQELLDESFADLLAA